MCDDNTTITTGEVATPVVEKKKRGRKPNPNKQKMYFSDKEEQAFCDYLSSTDNNYRNKIYNEILHPAFSKMVESIIRKYILFKPGEDFQDTFDDVMSHLMSKVDKFNPNKLTKAGKAPKAYSYCGTICKNYALHERQKAQARINDTFSYEDVYGQQTPDTMEYVEIEIDDYDFNKDIMQRASVEINNMIHDPEKYNLNEYDVKIGMALVNILNDWDTIFSEVNSNKYNKSQIDLFIREFASLDGASGTKRIREAKKKFAVAYFKIKDEMLEED